MTRSIRHILGCAGFLLVAAAPTRSWALTESFCDFSSVVPFTLNGNAFQGSSKEIRLTTATANEAGSAFMTAPIPLTAATSFHTYFRFQMGPSAVGGDGIAFVLQNAATGAAALGGLAGNMGYSGITPSVIIEFDTFKNGANDTNANHVGLMLNGSATTHTAMGTPAFTMAGGGVLNAWVDYIAGAPGTINVYLAQTAVKPGTPIVTHALNLFTQLASPTKLFAGFTAATGPNPPNTELNEQDVLEWELSTDGIPCFCEGDTDCNGATPACDVAGICAICSATNKTACTGATPVCDVPINSCVGCLSNANCADPKPICANATLTCRACATNADCGGGTPFCATTGPSVGDCVVCIADANCPPSSPRCNTTTNTCAQCLSAADCGGDTPLCIGQLCKPCGSDADCGGNTPACEVWGACGQCSATNPSQCNGGTTICDFPSGTCVGCEFNTDCGGSSPICNLASHTCQACATDADCVGSPSGTACALSGMKVGQCVVCATNADCSGATPVCDAIANQCVICLADSDCSGLTPLCDTNVHQCVGCQSSSDCNAQKPVCNLNGKQCSACENDYQAQNPGPLACSTPALPACQPGGDALAGECTVCSAFNQSLCIKSVNTPVCVVASAVCGCGQDVDCNAGNYCDTSVTMTGVCNVGCRVMGGVDNCGAGMYCSKQDGTIGACQAEPCSSNADCKSPNPICNTIVQPHTCVPCLNDPDCPNNGVCDITTNMCVQCTSKETQNCMSSATGPLCLATQLCGCAADSDCGSASSGRVCDATKHVCEAGCRGVGGNKCPNPMLCSSSTNAIGQCMAPGTTATASSSTGQGGAGGAAPSDVGAGGLKDQTVVQSAGCGCRVADDQNGDGCGALAGLLAGLAVMRRRRRRVGVDKGIR